MSHPDLAETIAALSAVTFPAGAQAKCFVRNVCAMRAANLSSKQVEYIYALAWRFRRQMPTALIPPPPPNLRLKKAPKSPRRLCVPSAVECPPGVVWCGYGSRWADPFLADVSGVKRCLHLFYVSMFRPSYVQTYRTMTTPRLPTAQEKYETHVATYQIWLRTGLMPQAEIDPALREAMSPDSQAFTAIPAAPATSEIRDALAGRSLADITPLKRWSHVDELFKIANGVGNG